MGYITNVRLHKIGWKGTYHSFILHWCDKLRLYEELIPPGERFTDNVKRSMLKNTVVGIQTLKSVKDIQNHDKAWGEEPLTYNENLNLLLAYATSFDASRGLTNTRKRIGASRSQIGHTLNQTILDEPYIHDIDSYLINEVNLQESESTTLIYKNKLVPHPLTNRPKMSKERWLSLSILERQAWETFSNCSKGIILRIVKPETLPRYQNNVHNISAADYQIMIHQNEYNVNLNNSKTPIIEDNNTDIHTEKEKDVKIS